MLHKEKLHTLHRHICGRKEKITNFLGPKKLHALVLVALVAIFVLGTFLRFVDISERYAWWGDIGRDLLVSNHIWKYGEEVQIGHSASGLVDGSCGIQNYPNYYYYYLAFFWSLTQSFQGVVALVLVTHCLAILFCYLLVAKIHNRLAGLYAALFFAVSYQFISQGRVIIGLQVAIPFCILATYLVVLSLYRRSRVINILGLLLLVFMSTFHYSALVIFGYLLIVSEVTFAKGSLIVAEKKFALNGLAYFAFFLALHYQVIRACNGVPQFLSMFFGTHSLKSVGDLSFLLALFKAHVSALFPIATFQVATMVAGCSLFALIFAKKSRLPILLAALFSLVLLSSSVMYKSQFVTVQELQTLYVRLGLFLVSVLSVGFSLSETISRKWHILTAVVGVCALAIIFSTSQHFFVLQEQSVDHSYEMVAQILWEKDELKPFDAHLYKEDSGDYDTALLGFWLEQVSGEKLYKTRNRANNYLLLDPNPKYKIFVCDLESNPTDLNCQYNLTQFQVDNGTYYPLDDTFEAEDSRYRIHVFRHQD